MNKSDIIKELNLKDIQHVIDVTEYNLPGSIKKHEIVATNINNEICLIEIRFAFDNSFFKQDLVDFLPDKKKLPSHEKRYILYYYNDVSDEVIKTTVSEELLVNQIIVTHVYIPIKGIKTAKLKAEFDRNFKPVPIKGTLLSIVIPTYNSGKYLEQVLQSIINQIGFEEKEIIIVDAVSKDDTLAIVNKYCTSNDVVISEKDDGIFDAINKGTYVSRGLYSLFLGSDDFLLNGSLYEFKKIYLENPDKDFYYGNILTLKNNVLIPKHTFITKPEFGKFNIAHPALFINKSAFDDVKGFNITYKVCSDADFELKLIRSGKSSKKIDAFISVFRSGGFSDLNPQKVEEAKRIYKSHNAMNWKYRVQIYKFLLLWFYRKCIKNE